ncbi:nucleobase-ascorbate transporter 4 [Nicotiana attenuata]|uniref:Nucleobase-ascorbate transporter 4 n=1 Tax=Nicotiana attenuata TaxID=49451 RepID=A0A1J6L529_NICAT|nr:nucleobase-ascorbate transporter 4 [Nicotiana attenuata]
MWKLKQPLFEQFAVLLSVGIVWAFAALLTVAGAYQNRPLQTQFSCRVDRSGLVSGASWIRFPYTLQWGTPNVDAGEVFLMLAAAFVSLIEVYIQLKMFRLIFDVVADLILFFPLTSKTFENSTSYPVLTTDL